MELCAKVMQLGGAAGPSCPSDEEWKTVENEIRVLTTLSHIVRLYDQFHDESKFYLMLELCKGGSLQTELVRAKGFSMHRFRTIGRQIVSALAHCHHRRIAHHDIKLGNILLDEYGRCKLADFGISVQTSVPGELTDQYAGSVQYEAPELVNRKPHDPFKSDMWALGVLFAYMITGASPWTADTVGKLMQQIPLCNYRLRRNTPPEIAELIERMIVVDPDQRITCSELLRHPLFRHVAEEPRESVLDCLSPLGRRHLPRVEITTETEAQGPPVGEAFTMSDSVVLRDTTIENSRTLSIVNTNLNYGFNAKPRPVKRYRPVQVGSYLSTFGPNHIHVPSEDSEDGATS
jgi:serine/threonine protein kinase